MGLVEWLIVLLLYGLTYWRLLGKVGRPGWMGLIPGWNEYALVRGSGGGCLLASAWAFVSSVYVGMQVLAIYGWDVPSWFLLIVPLINVLVLVLLVMTASALSHAFGLGIWWTIGLVIFRPLMLFVLAFGSARLVSSMQKDGETFPSASRK